MNNFLSESDVVDILQAANQGESCLCSSKWLTDLASKITNTLKELNNLNSNQKNKSITDSTVHENIKWLGQLMYKHRGFSIPRYEDLGFFLTDSKDKALTLAKSRAQIWIDETFEEKEIEHWDVKVRPSTN